MKTATLKTPALDKLKPTLERRSPRITCAAPGQELWDLWKDYVEPEHIREKWNFQLMVIVDSFLGPLAPRYQYILDMGVPHLKAVYAQQPLPDGDLMFVFPDRWITPRFAIMFNTVLNANPSIVAEAKFGRRRKILIVCFQPYIVGDCMKEQVKIIREDSKTEEKWKPDMRSLWGIPEDRW